MSAPLTVHVGPVAYRATTCTPRLLADVHAALTGLGLVAWVPAHGWYRDEWGALRPVDTELGERITRRNG